MGDHSFVYWYSSLEKHLCGYCKNPKGNVSHGMWAKILTIEDYQNLIDRGWRRSGNYCYKPIMDEVCCPMYTIKCDALNFQLSKSQKKVIKKFNKFLKDGVLNQNPSQQEDQLSSDNISEFVHREVPAHVLEGQLESDDFVIDSDVVDHKFDKNSTSQTGPIPGVSSGKQEKAVAVSKVMSSSMQPKSGMGADPNKPPCKKAKILRLERKKEKLQKQGIKFERQVKNEQKTLEQFLNEVPSDGKHKFKITLEQIHENHIYFQLTANLFAKYQMSVHNESPDDCDQSQYLNFLIDTPLKTVRFSRGSELGFGSFHQLYWLDDKLIAVGVIDILPKCVSAVYFFYDPDYRDLTLGTYGSLREVEFVRSLHQKMPSIQNYYMGFYIHSCPKMRYKGKLTPSYLLCPETYHWTPIERCLEKLEVSKYSRLDEDLAAVDENLCTSKDIDEIRILYNRKIMLLKQYMRKFAVQDLFNTIGRLIGQKCAKSIIFIADN